MTRINSAIAVRNLTDEHLLAEHRQIKRLPYYLDKACQSGSINRIPKEFTLGKGHVLFFLNKQDFISKRYKLLHDECVARGFNVADYSNNWFGLDFYWKYLSHSLTSYWWDYQPTDKERNLLMKRITERIMGSSKKCFHYYGEPISKDKAIELLKQ